MKTIVLIALLIMSSAFAKDYKHTISGGSGGTAIVDTDQDLAVALTGSYSYLLASFIQVETTFSAAFYDQEGDDSNANAFAANLGPVFNIFCTDKNKLQNSFFITPKVGIARIATTYWWGDTTDTTAFASLEIGKRFAINERVSLNLSAYAIKYIGDDVDDDISVQFNFLSFSFYL